MLSNQEKIRITAELCKSETFAKSAVQSSLLEYLVKATLKGENLKELTIGIDFFDEELDSLKTGARVRGAVYNLRKKLNAYYENEGKNDIWRITIEKGQYAVKFEKNVIKSSKISSVTILKYLPWSLTAILIAILVFQLKPKSDLPIWDDFINSTKTSTVYVGDYFGMIGTTITGELGWTRDFNINTMAQYYELGKNKPALHESTQPSNIYYTTPFAVYSVNSIARFTSGYNWNYNIRFSSKAVFSEIKEGNIIYLGPTKNENKFIDLFNSNNPYFKIDSVQVKFANHATLPDTVFSLTTSNDLSDLTIIARLRGSNDSEQLYFFSNHDMGITTSVEYFTNNNSLENFEYRYLKNSDYFIAIARAVGKNRTSFDLNFEFVVALK